MNIRNADVARRKGPLDDAPWPDKLTARVVAPGDTPRLHGYDVEGDLARHYSFVETVLLSLTGELPSPPQARAFEIALQFLSPATVNEAPTHAAVIVRICNVLTSAILGTAAIGLGEEARASLVQHEGWLRCLDAGATAAAAEWAPQSQAERASVERLRDALLGAGVVVPILNGNIGRTPAILATLRFAGLQRAEQMEVAFVLARLPATLAEALATPSHSYRDYPVDLPAVRYTEES
jgi:hypothetical protein